MEQVKLSKALFIPFSKKSTCYHREWEWINLTGLRPYLGRLYFLGGDGKRRLRFSIQSYLESHEIRASYKDRP